MPCDMLRSGAPRRRIPRDVSPNAPINAVQSRRLAILTFVIALAAPLSAFRLSPYSYGPHRVPRKAHPLNFHSTARAKSSASIAMSSTSNPPPMESDISSSIEELESLHRMRQLMSQRDLRTEQSTPPSNADDPAEPQQPHPRPAKKHKPTITSILKKPVGELTTSDLTRLCNSLASNKRGESFYNLRKLERILLEIDHRENNQQTPGGPLLKLRVFPLLTALSNDLRARKQMQLRAKKNPIDRRKSPRVSAQDIKRLVQVIKLLSKHRNSNNLDPGCYTKDVPSFAVMIAADASYLEPIPSRWEPSSVDAALLFLDMVEKEEDLSDPRPIGAVMNAMARRGMAEEAQKLLERALGGDIPTLDSNRDEGAKDGDAVSTSAKRLSSSEAGPCYDALLRAWSKKAALIAQEAGASKPVKKKRKAMRHALAQARHILLNHMPLQPQVTTNKSRTAVLQGYAAVGMGREAEKLLFELEALHLSPLSSMTPPEPSPSSSTLDTACYNTVLSAYSQTQDPDGVVRAERLFRAMKDQTPLDIAVENQSISLLSEDESKESPVFSVVPPRPDVISLGATINCCCRHGEVSMAESLLDEMRKSCEPNAACFLPILQALEKSDDADAPERVLSLIKKSEHTLRRTNRLIYTHALRCMRRHGRGEEAEVVLDWFHRAFPHRGGPDVYSYILVLRSYEKTKPKEDRHTAAERAELFFDVMQERVKESLLPALDVNAYNILLNCYARAGEADKVEQLLSALEDGTDVRPNSKSYSFLIKALAISDAPDAEDRAWNVLRRLGYPSDVKSQKPVPFNVSIDVVNALLKLLAKSGKAKEAEALLSQMDELVVDGVMKGGGPNIRSYEAVLEALGRCNDVDAPARAEALVTRLEVMSEMGGEFEPSLLAYNTLLNVYANAGMAGKAERLLESLHWPDEFSVGSTLKSLVNSGKSQEVSISRAESLADTLGSGNEVIFTHRLRLCSKFGLGQQAEELIHDMEKQHITPSLIHYTVALNAWAKSKDRDATIRAETLFHVMEQKFDLDLAAFHGLLINYTARGNVKKAYRLLQRLLNSPDIEPNKSTFTMVIDSISRSKSNDAGDKAAKLLDGMRELHAAGNNEVEPDRVTYASVLRCIEKKSKDWSRFDKIKIMRELQMESWPFD